MSVADLLARLRDRGIHLRVEDGRLRSAAKKGALTPELSAEIKANKAELMELLSEVEPAQDVSGRIPRTRERTRFPLSITQLRAAVSARGGASLPTAFRLEGPLNQQALQATLATMVDRHAPLRTVFHLDQDMPEQEVQAAPALSLECTDLGELIPEVRRARLDELLAELSSRRFNVTELPLFRFHLIKLAPQEHVLYAGFSALIFDGWSFDVFWNELRLGYAALAASEPWPLPELPMEYADFVAYQQRSLEEREQALESYWRKQLGAQLPALPLGTDRARPPISSNLGGNLGFQLPPETVIAMRSFARARGVTTQMVMLSALYALLHRLGDAQDIVVATPVAARSHADMQGLMGPFVNMLLLRVGVDPSKSFASFVIDVRDRCVSAYDHQDFPIERLRVRSPSGSGGVLTPAFQVEFSFQEVSERGAEMGRVRLSQLELESGAATNDLTLWVKDWGDRIAGALEFKSELYDRSTVELWSRCYVEILDGLLQDPDRPLGEVPVSEIDAARRLPVSAAPTERPTGHRESSTATDMEGRMCALFEDLLDVPSVHVDDNYFDLGGNSLIAVRLFGEIQRQYGPRLTQATLLRAGTPRLLAQAVAEHFGRGDGCLVELRPGSGDKCLFLVHDADGETLLYLNLARHLPESLSVVGVEPRAAGPVPMVHTSLEQCAAHYVKVLRKRQPTGPYYVGGLCAGGLIAFEVARQLVTDGQQVGLAVFLEAAPPTADKRITLGQQRLARVTGQLRALSRENFLPTAQTLASKVVGGLRYEQGATVRRVKARALYTALQRLFVDGQNWPTWLPVPSAREVFQLAEARYVPRFTPGVPALLVRASEALQSLPGAPDGDQPFRELLVDPGFGWQPLLEVPVKIVDVPGGHSSMLREPHVRTLASHISQQMALPHAGDSDTHPKRTNGKGHISAHSSG